MKEFNVKHIIELVWNGPIPPSEVKKIIEGKGNPKGIYQIYGSHPTSGPGTLLYIGQTKNFDQRFKNHLNWIKDELDEVKIYLGTILSKNPNTSLSESDQINVAEKLLIYYCAPPYNSQNIQGEPGKEFKTNHVIVMNIKQKCMLPYEVSTMLFHANGWGK